jgi:protein-disulfide isomerase/uncharacterized membrane protein
VLGFSSLAITALAVYQWFELLAIRSGKTAACSINETINCATVWNSPFAAQVHDISGIPVAGLGVIFGTVGALLTLMLWSLSKKPASLDTWTNALKVLAAVGVLSCVTFISASVAAKALCLTCLGTYALTGLFAFAAFKLLPAPMIPSAGKWPLALAWCSLIAVPTFLALQVPGHNTPHAEPPRLSKGETPSAPQDLNKFFEELPENERLSTAYARDVWMKSQPQETSAYAVRQRVGPTDAPVKIVEFTDTLCGHCRQFEGVMAEILKIAPPNLVSIEARQFPLDKECNADMQASPKDGTRCMGARVQICLEGTDKFVPLREALFQNQEKLTSDKILEVALAVGAVRETLLACIASQDTEDKLKQDIAFAKQYQIKGTPLVLLNGKEAPPAPAFLFGMVMSKGDVNAPYFLKLPPPPEE